MSYTLYSDKIYVLRFAGKFYVLNFERLANFTSYTTYAKQILLPKHCPCSKFSTPGKLYVLYFLWIVNYMSYAFYAWLILRPTLCTSDIF